MRVFKRVLCLVVLVAAGIVGADGVFGAERVVVIGDEVVVDGATESFGLISQLRRTFAEERRTSRSFLSAFVGRPLKTGARSSRNRMKKTRRPTSKASR